MRFLATSKGTPGDHLGQAPTGYRWPFGPVAVIAPFNFPLEIPLMQMLGALYMGNKVLIKPDLRVAFPMEQFVRYLHYCGLPKEDVDFLYDKGEVMEHILVKTPMR